MRGRTLNHAFIILDEAQNTTPEQMKMFLTRIGFGSKAVVTGDITQIDLPRGQQERPDRSRTQVLKKMCAVRGVQPIHSSRGCGAPPAGRPKIVTASSAYEQRKDKP